MTLWNHFIIFIIPTYTWNTNSLFLYSSYEHIYQTPTNSVKKVQTIFIKVNKIPQGLVVYEVPASELSQSAATPGPRSGSDAP